MSISVICNYSKCHAKLKGDFKIDENIMTFPPSLTHESFLQENVANHKFFPDSSVSR